MKTIITKVENNRVVKFIETDDADNKLAELLVNYPQAFIYDGKYSPDLYVLENKVTIKPEIETLEQIAKRLDSCLRVHLNDIANSYQYDSIASMTDYRDDPNPKFNSEGWAAFKWRSACYTLADKFIAGIKAGLTEIPTDAEFIADMPNIKNYFK
jgi:hypothetical protein